MKKNFLLFLISFLSFLCYQEARASMPIVAFYGPVVVKELSVSEYQALKDCGFTHTLNSYNTVDIALAGYFMGDAPK